MDVTKLFDLPDDKLTPLESDKLDAMIAHAVAQPQIQPSGRRPANQNTHHWRRLVAIAAAFVIVIAATVQMDFSEVAPVSNSDAFDDVSDMLMMETLNDLS